MKAENGSVLVVGGGIGGMQAALDLSDAGFYVYLVEKESAVGGRMVQLDKTFPTNDCSMCTISPRLVQIGMNPNIKILTNTYIEKLEGESPVFTAHLKTKPRFIDIKKCTSCGECVSVCTVDLSNSFELGMSNKKAVYKQYPQAAPNAFAITKTGTAPCKNACPAHVHTQGYIALAKARKFKEALDLIRKDLPLPSICGRVCAHPCEDACYRGERDKPVSIRSIKRYVADFEQQIEEQRATSPLVLDSSRKVAVVGSGPAGLSAAYFLAKAGCFVTVFESMPKPGGMMRYGVPDYRLSSEAVDRDINYILSLGVELKTNVTVGKDISISDLAAQQYKKIFIATGLHKSRELNISGEDNSKVLRGTDMLRDVALGKKVKVGKCAAVIGGGNVSIDVARTCLRLGASHVTMICLEKLEDMPAHEEEIEEAIEEGISIINGYGIDSLNDNSSTITLNLKSCISCFDSQGRFSPKYDLSVKKTIEANTVVTAIGQQTDQEMLANLLPSLGNNKLEVDTVSLKIKTIQNKADCELYAGGDLISGPKTIIEAVAMGRRAAESILASFDERELKADWPNLAPVSARDESKKANLQKRIADKKRLPKERIKDFEEVAQTFSLEEAVSEAERCLSCADCSECLQCVSACAAGAINHNEHEQIQTLNIGAVLLAPGFEQFDTKLVGEYGFGRYANVVSSMMIERMLSASGPSKGHIIRPSDRKSPQKIAWIQCVGSRDERKNKSYCSAVCCMFATKQAIIIRDHFPEIEAHIFYIDMRAYGKGFDSYVERAKNQYGVHYHRGMISKIYELPNDQGLELKFLEESKELQTEKFDLVVLSSGITPSKGVRNLAEICGIKLDEFGFAKKKLTQPHLTEKKGVYVAGVMEGPRDIPETVISASAASVLIESDIREQRWSDIVPKTYPAERDVLQEKPRVGVFVCRCGFNIARTVDVPSLTSYAQTLADVVHAEENLYTCSADTQVHIAEMIEKHRLNRVVVASCTPRTHEPLFQETLKNAGLNKYLFEMANIRDQCAWVHADDEKAANVKAKDLVRMSVGRARELAPLPSKSVQVEKSALVIGGGVSGMTAALSLAEQGFSAVLVEKQKALGGNLLNISSLEDGNAPIAFVSELIQKTLSHPDITVFTDSELAETSGYVGKFKSTIRTKGKTESFAHGAVIVALGGDAYLPEGEYQYGHHKNIVTQLDIEHMLMTDINDLSAAKHIVMIQCVGSRQGDNPVCSRVCCTQAVKNAIRLKNSYPELQITVLYRDIRTYGMRELLYREARRKGVLFVKYTTDKQPIVSLEFGEIHVTIEELGLKRQIDLKPNYLVLSTGIRPAKDNKKIADMLKLSIGKDGFFSEAHVKLKPVDMAVEGFFLAGLAHGPKMLDECISQAQGAAARAATVLAKDTLPLSSEISEVDPSRCVGCLTCVRACPYNVPQIGNARTAEIEPAACQGCGICAAACPRKAITTKHSTDRQIIAKMEALFADLRTI